MVGGKSQNETPGGELRAEEEEEEEEREQERGQRLRGPGEQRGGHGDVEDLEVRLDLHALSRESRAPGRDAALNAQRGREPGGEDEGREREGEDRDQSASL